MLKKLLNFFIAFVVLFLLAGEASHATDSAQYFHKIDAPAEELVARVASTPVPKVRSSEEILSAIGVTLEDLEARKVSATKQEEVRQSMAQETFRVLEGYNQIQIILQNIFMQITDDARNMPAVRANQQFFQHLNMIQEALIRFVWDDIESTQPSNIRCQGDLIVDYFLHHAALIHASCADGLTTSEAAPYKANAMNNYLISMADFRAEGLQDPLDIREMLRQGTSSVYKGVHVFKFGGVINIFQDQIDDLQRQQFRGNVAIITCPTPLGRLLQRMPEAHQHKSQFGFLTFLNLMCGGAITDAAVINANTQLFLTGSKPIEKRYTFISPRDVEVEGLRPPLSRLRDSLPAAKESLQLILKYFDQETFVQVVKGGSIDEALCLALKVWREVLSLHHDYFEDIARRVEMTTDNLHQLRNAEVVRLLMEANSVATDLENFSGADYLFQFERLERLKNELAEVVADVKRSFPATQDKSAASAATSSSASLPVPEFVYVKLEVGMEEMSRKAKAEALALAKKTDARVQRKEAAKTVKNHKQDARKADAVGASSASTSSSSSSSVIDADRAQVNAKRKRKEITSKFRRSLEGSEYFPGNQEQITARLAAIKETNRFNELSTHLTDKCGPGHNLELLKDQQVWSVRVNDQYRITFNITEIDGVPQKNPLRVTDLQLSNHYKGVNKEPLRGSLSIF